MYVNKYSQSGIHSDHFPLSDTIPWTIGIQIRISHNQRRRRYGEVDDVGEVSVARALTFETSEYMSIYKSEISTYNGP